MKEVIVRNNEGKAISVLGDHQVFKLTGKETGGRIAVIMQELPPGAGVPLHVHSNEDEIFHIIEGELEITIHEEAVHLRVGDTIMLPKNLPHAIKNPTKQAAKAMISIYPAGIENMFAELSDLPVGSPDLARVSEICWRYGIKFV